MGLMYCEDNGYYKRVKRMKSWVMGRCLRHPIYKLLHAQKNHYSLWIQFWFESHYLILLQINSKCQKKHTNINIIYEIIKW